MSDINARRLELLAKVRAVNPSDIEAALLLGEIEEFMELLGVYPSPALVQAQGVSDGNLITRLQGLLQPLPTPPAEQEIGK